MYIYMYLYVLQFLAKRKVMQFFQGIYRTFNLVAALLTWVADPNAGFKIFSDPGH